MTTSFFIFRSEYVSSFPHLFWPHFYSSQSIMWRAQHGCIPPHTCLGVGCPTRVLHLLSRVHVTRPKLVICAAKWGFITRRRAKWKGSPYNKVARNTKRVFMYLIELFIKNFTALGLHMALPLAIFIRIWLKSRISKQ